MQTWINMLRSAGLIVKTRSQWGSQHRVSANRMGKPKYGFVHITVTYQRGTPNERTRHVEDIGISRFENTGISYTAIYHRDNGGEVHIGQPDGRRGAHTLNDKGVDGFEHNLNVYGDAIAYCGMVDDDFFEQDADNLARYFAARQLAGVANYQGIYLHRKFAWKDCPGDLVARFEARINELFRHYVKHGLPGTNDTKDWFDMADKADLLEALDEYFTSRKGRRAINQALTISLRGGSPLSRELVGVVVNIVAGGVARAIREAATRKTKRGRHLGTNLRDALLKIGWHKRISQEVHNGPSSDKKGAVSHDNVLYGRLGEIEDQVTEVLDQEQSDAKAA